MLNQGKITKNCFSFENNTIQLLVIIGNKVVLWRGNHIIKDPPFIASYAGICVDVETGKQCFVGVNAILSDNIKVGGLCAMGAGALLLANVFPHR